MLKFWFLKDLNLNRRPCEVRSNYIMFRVLKRLSKNVSCFSRFFFDNFLPRTAMCFIPICYGMIMRD